jgi:isopenicillin N synthase-like dioxygenase
MMARWINDRWVSTLHRAVNPVAERAAGSRHRSSVFFHNPNYDAEIRCLPTCLAPDEVPKYQADSSGEHLHT